uniref:Prolyl 4-hydroxylase alpha subunit Fe(2+) 2OG dioxygenase domain-containing protein n=1 Tax=viral metagenome TaxID=1070528 RepID=A0A6C0JEF7_9ZZZZ
MITELSNKNNQYILLIKGGIPINIANELIDLIDEKSKIKFKSNKRIQFTRTTDGIPDKYKTYILKILKSTDKYGLSNSIISDKITISRHKTNEQILPHYDKNNSNDTTIFKGCIYLSCNIGTTFILEDGSEITPNVEPGDIVLFDINLKHYGNIIPKNIVKYIFGFRLNKQ